MSAPSAPANVAIVIASTNPSLTWDLNSNTLWFEIWRLVAGDSKWTLRAGPTSRENLGPTAVAWADDIYWTQGFPAPAGKKYNGAVTYMIRAVNYDGASDWVTVSTTVITGGSTFAVTAMPTLVAYAACVGGQLHELALTDTVVVTRSLSISAPGTVKRAGQYLFVGEYDFTGSGVATIVNRALFTVTGSVTHGNLLTVRDAIVEGNLVYVASQTGASGAGSMTTVSIATPSAPSVVSSAVDLLDLMAGPAALAKWNNYVFVGANTTQTIVLVNVNDPTAPVIYRHAQVWSVGEGPVAFYLEYPNLFCAYDHGSMASWDVSNPANPRSISGIDGDCYSTRGMARTPNRLTTLNPTGLLTITNVCNSSLMHLERQLQLPAGEWHDVVVTSDRAYCLGNGKMCVVDTLNTLTLLNTITDSAFSGDEPGNIIL